jgi:hypothetical protein
VCSGVVSGCGKWRPGVRSRMGAPVCDLFLRRARATTENAVHGWGLLLEPFLAGTVIF